ncbi:MAG: hypothetical protein NTY25_01290 [Planctomycetia bacterium]|nr:hypothetical protein [Planctomycetia bacterium]
MSSPDSSNNDSPDVDSGGQADVDPLEMPSRSPQILQVLTAFVDSFNVFRVSTESRLAQMEDRSLSVARESQKQTRLLRNALERPAGPASAAELVPRQMLQVVRSMLWSLEGGPEGPQALRLPRPSIIGRALYDLQHEATSTYNGSVPAEIYIKISVQGEHHLSETPRTYVTRYIAGETSDMSGKIGIHLEPRFEVLTQQIAERLFAEKFRKRRYLTGYGSTIFNDWPHWDARDDDLTGYGPSPSGSPAPAPAGGTGTN